MHLQDLKIKHKSHKCELNVKTENKLKKQNDGEMLGIGK